MKQTSLLKSRAISWLKGHGGMWKGNAISHYHLTEWARSRINNPLKVGCIVDTSKYGNPKIYYVRYTKDTSFHIPKMVYDYLLSLEGVKSENQ